MAGYLWRCQNLQPEGLGGTVLRSSASCRLWCLQNVDSPSIMRTGPSWCSRLHDKWQYFVHHAPPKLNSGTGRGRMQRGLSRQNPQLVPRPTERVVKGLHYHIMCDSWAIKWNISYVTFKWCFNAIYPKLTKKNVLFALERHLGHNPFNRTTVKDATFCSSVK
jgi:hypothetical protein